MEYQPLQYGPGMGAGGAGGSMFGINHFGSPAGVMPGSTSNANTPTPTGINPAGAAAPSIADTLSAILSGAGDPVANGAAVPGVTGAAGAEDWFGKIGGLEGIGSIFKGLGDLGSVYAAIQGVGLAKEQMKLSRDSYNTNLANTTQSYNTDLRARREAMAASDGDSQAKVERYLRQHSL